MNITKKLIDFVIPAYFHCKNTKDEIFSLVSANGEWLDLIYFKNDDYHGPNSIYERGLYMCSFSDELLEHLNIIKR